MNKSWRRKEENTKTDETISKKVELGNFLNHCFQKGIKMVLKLI